MPDNNTLRDAVRRSTYGHLSEDATQTDVQIARKITIRMGIADPSDTFRVLNYVRSARRAYEAGKAIQNQQDQKAPAIPTAVDPALQGEIANYRYRTIIEIVDPRTGSKYSTVVPIDSTVPLSPEQIRREAMAGWTTIRGTDRFYVDRSALPADAQPTVTIIGGGRKGE